MMKLNGYQANAVIRRDKKTLLCYAIARALAAFHITIKKLTEITDTNYSSLCVHLCKPDTISIERLEVIHDKLHHWIDENCSGDSRYKLYSMTAKEVIETNCKE
ncbi:hypothetical protein PGN80_13115 [Klebsiella aerogenes]|uniref:hypothetical protein n=1 Tax=Klebsiella aerogenes TaxID=548 RepID=UPI00301CAD9E